MCQHMYIHDVASFLHARIKGTVDFTEALDIAFCNPVGNGLLGIHGVALREQVPSLASVYKDVEGLGVCMHGGLRRTRTGIAQTMFKCFIGVKVTLMRQRRGTVEPESRHAFRASIALYGLVALVPRARRCVHTSTTPSMPCSTGSCIVLCAVAYPRASRSEVKLIRASEGHTVLVYGFLHQVWVEESGAHARWVSAVCLVQVNEGVLVGGVEAKFASRYFAHVLQILIDWHLRSHA